MTRPAQELPDLRTSSAAVDWLLHVLAPPVLIPALAALLPVLVIVVPGLLVAAAVLTAAIERGRHRHWQDGARLITVLAPPRPEPEGAAALWGNLAGLLRPRWRRLLFGQPHLCFEYHLTPQASRIRMWVPGPVPPGLVERAITAAWPGATTHTTPARPHPSSPTPNIRRQVISPENFGPCELS